MPAVPAVPQVFANNGLDFKTAQVRVCKNGKKGGSCAASTYRHHSRKASCSARAKLAGFKKILIFCKSIPQVSEPVVCSSQEASLGAIEILAKKDGLNQVPKSKVKSVK